MKATVRYPDGRVVELEGTSEEVGDLLVDMDLDRDHDLEESPYQLQPFIFSPEAYERVEQVLGCQHEYPDVWLATIPPPCKKCGLAAPDFTYSVHQQTSNNGPTPKHRILQSSKV